MMKLWERALYRAYKERADDGCGEKSLVASIERYRFAASHAQGKTILDLGCGVGYGTCLLAKEDVSKVVGGDNDEESLAMAAGRYGGGKHVWVNLDALNLPFDDQTFDLIACFEVIEHVRTPSKLLGECKRVLKKGGLLILSTPNDETHFALPRNPHHVGEFTPRSLTDLMGKEFARTELCGQDFVQRRWLPVEKWRTLAFTFTGVILAVIPFGDRVRALLASLFARGNRRVSLLETVRLYETLGEWKSPHRVVVWHDRTWVPSTLVALARTPCPETPSDSDPKTGGDSHQIES
jgi:2-polyprenyl-3-methyl-5-hydroxy-6-metoxy-1,4-benzoquinol methylase